jgi:hypothetical protein
MRGKYLPKRRLEELNQTLSVREKSVLRTLLNCRYLITGQVQRLHFTDSVSELAANRAAHRTMRKLHDLGVTEFIERRVGGIRAGSKSYVWTLTESGVHLLHLGNPKYSPRKRAFEPSLNFLKHTLEVAETYTQLTEICRRNQLDLVKTELEPVCWRNYTGEDGKPATMKPDMFAVTANREYQDSWLLEVDLGTESPIKVLDKCRRYVFYCKSGIEQKQHGVFPLVVWLVYNANRKSKLQQYIAECRELSEASKRLFTVILPEEFETLICKGVDSLDKTKGAKIA